MAKGGMDMVGMKKANAKTVAKQDSKTNSAAKAFTSMKKAKKPLHKASMPMKKAMKQAMKKAKASKATKKASKPMRSAGQQSRPSVPKGCIAERMILIQTLHDLARHRFITMGKGGDVHLEDDKGLLRMALRGLNVPKGSYHVIRVVSKKFLNPDEGDVDFVNGTIESALFIRFCDKNTVNKHMAKFGGCLSTDEEIEEN